MFWLPLLAVASPIIPDDFEDDLAEDWGYENSFINDMIDGPLTICPGFKSDFFDAASIDLGDYPFKRGSEFTVKVAGELKKTITEGANINIVVKKGFLKVHEEDKDLCAEGRRDGQSCPVTPGYHNLNIHQQLTALAPRGSYNIKVLVTNGDQQTITCLSGAIEIQ